MTFTLTVECDNAAFERNTAHELARILQRVISDLKTEKLYPNDTTKLRDINGNTVGSYMLEDA